MSFQSYLNRRDYAFLGVGGLAVIIISLIMPSFVTNPIAIEAYTRLLIAAVIFYGLFAIHKAIQSWAGELARYLQLIGTGFAILMIAWIPHVGWHLRGNPAWAGLSPTTWLTLFHGFTLLAFMLASYGFHLFWKKG